MPEEETCTCPPEWDQPYPWDRTKKGPGHQIVCDLFSLEPLPEGDE